MSDPQDFYVTGGAVRLGSPSYVTRPADQELYEALEAGEFCYVLTSRQMGKTSLMIRAARRLQQAGCCVAMLDLTAIGFNLTVEQWYGSLLLQLGERLDREEELLASWQAHPQQSPLQRFTQALRQLMLREERRLVLFIDEIDAVRGLAFSADEFFAAIREFYNRRADDPLYERLTFCLLGVATPSDLIRNPHVTPFNLGRRIDLQDFTEAEAQGLTEGWVGLSSQTPAGLERATHLLRRVFYWTGGQPYLTQQLCRAVAAAHLSEGPAPGPWEVDRLCQELFLSAEGQARDHHLHFVRDWLLHSGTDRVALLELCQRLQGGKTVPDDERNPIIAAAKLAGVARTEGGFLRSRNRIYRQVFNQTWIRNHLPEAELRRQQSAYRRGVTRAALVATFVLLALILLTGWALAEKGRAEQSAQAARLSRQQAVEGRSLAEQSALRAREAEVRSTRLAAERVKALQLLRKALGQQQAARASAEAARRIAEGATQSEAFQRSRALYESHLAIAQRDNARRLLYTANIALAAEAAQRQDAERVLELLRPLRRLTQPRRLLDFEWRFLWQLCHPETLRVPNTVNTEQAALFSPDGRWLIAARDNQTVSLLDATTGRPFREFRQAGPPLAVSVDGTRLAAVTPAREIQVRELSTGAELCRFSSGAGKPRSLAFSPDGRRLAVSNEGGKACVWDLPGGSPAFTLPTDSRGIEWLGFSPGGDLLAAMDSTDPEHGLLRLFRAAEGRALPAWPVPPFHSPWATQVFTRDGRGLILAHTEHVLVRDLQTRELIRDLVHPARVTALVLSKDGRYLATAAMDRVVRLWDWERGRLLRPLMGLRRPAATLAFSPDDRLLLASGQEGLLRVWPVQDEQDLGQQMGAKTDWCQAVNFSPEGRWLASAWQNQGLWVWDRQARRRRILDPDAAMIHGMAFSPNGRWLAAAVRRRRSGAPGSVDVYDTTTWGRILHAQFSSSHVAFSPDSRLLAATGFRVPTDEIHLWSMPSGRALPSVPGRTWMAFSPDGKYLATADGLQPQIALYDVTRRKVAATLPAMASYGVFSPDGRRLVYQDIPGTVGAFDLPTRRLVFQSAVGTGGGRLAFSPDGHRVLCGGGMTGSFKVLDASSGRELLSWAAPAFVNDALLAPDGRSLAIAHGQGLRVIPIPTSAEISAFEARRL